MRHTDETRRSRARVARCRLRPGVPAEPACHWVASELPALGESGRGGSRGAPRPATFWKAWDSPVIAIGGGSFLTELVEIAGGRNVYGDDPRPSLDVTIEDVVRRDPDVVLAGPESAARMRAAPAWRALRAVREGRVLIVDTTLVGRPGVRLGEAAVSLARLLHPGSLP